MATKDQIKLVKASHRRIKDLLEGTGIEVRVSYTSADDTLMIVFLKHYKHLSASLELTRCTSLREVSTCSGIIEHIVREMTHEMGPKKFDPSAAIHTMEFNGAPFSVLTNLQSSFPL